MVPRAQSALRRGLNSDFKILVKLRSIKIDIRAQHRTASKPLRLPTLLLTTDLLASLTTQHTRTSLFNSSSSSWRSASSFGKLKDKQQLHDEQKHHRNSRVARKHLDMVTNVVVLRCRRAAVGRLRYQLFMSVSGFPGKS